MGYAPEALEGKALLCFMKNQVCEWKMATLLQSQKTGCTVPVKSLETHAQKEWKVSKLTGTLL